MARKKLLFISSFFPNPTAPNIATYNRQLMLALADFYDISAVVPIPWTSRLFNRDNRKDGMLGNIKIKYPTYYYSPYILRKLYGIYYYQSIKKSVLELTSNNTFDLIYSSWLYPDAWVAAKIANDFHLPLFVSVLGTDVNRLRDTSFLAKKALDVAECAWQIMCVSSALKDKLVSIGVSRDKLFVLQNGIDSKIFYPMDRKAIRGELGIPSCDKVILFVGNLKKEKGLTELCLAFSSLIQQKLVPECRLLVIGDGRFRSSMERQLAKFNDKARILGERSLECIAKYMNASDVLCLPSYSEGQPNVVMEALACHTRVVATAVGGTPDLDRGYGNIRLVPPKTVNELTRALHEVLTDGFRCQQWYEFNNWNYNAAYLHELFETAKLGQKWIS